MNDGASNPACPRRIWCFFPLILLPAALPVTNLAHGASSHSREKIAPSKPGTKHLGCRRDHSGLSTMKYPQIAIQEISLSAPTGALEGTRAAMS